MCYLRMCLLLRKKTRSSSHQFNMSFYINKSSDRLKLISQGSQEAVSIASRQESAVKIELMHYLDNPSKEISSLLVYPHVKAAFVKYNTTLPSSAPVKRLFSIGGYDCYTTKIRRSNETFERLPMLKMNCRFPH